MPPATLGYVAHSDLRYPGRERGFQAEAGICSDHVAEDESLRATGTVVEVDHPTRGKYLSVGNPIKLSDSPADVKRSPLLGEHTDEILREVLGFGDHQVAEIHDSGALAPPRKEAAE